ncbi:MAG: hypothetical protein HY796_02775 [Elusimicrobia bacterium]|nr:hypothetical protein [Elusimicrobiota bacterium]
MKISGVKRRVISLFSGEGVKGLFALGVIAGSLCRVPAPAFAGDLYPGNGSAYGGISTPVDLCPVHLAVSTPSSPADGGFAIAQPNYAWTGPSTGVAVGLANFQVQVSSNDPDFAGTVMDILTPVGTVNTSLPTADGTYKGVGYTLATATTYYWRIRGVSYAGNYGPWSSTSSFLTDFSSPSVSGFATFSSTGGWLGESQWTKLATGVTAQMLAQDLISGLSITTGTFSVQYSTNAGAAWTTVVSTLTGAAPYLALSGAHGSTDAQTLTAYNLDLVQSTNTQTCGGAPCGATNQVRFSLADRGGNVETAGPYAVLSDTTLPAGVTAAPTGIGDYTVSVLAWAGDALSGVMDYNHELALSIDFDTGYSSSNFTGTAYSFTGLYDGATYYLRSYARDNAYNLSAPSTAVSTMTSGIVYFTAQDAAPVSLLQGTSAAFLIFDLNANPGRSTYLQQVKAVRLGNIPDADIAAVYIYLDNGDGTFGAGDSQLGDAVVTAGTATINITPQFIDGTSRRFFVVYKLSASAGVGRTAGARLAAADSLTFVYPFRAAGTFPADSTTAAVADGPNILAITPESLAPDMTKIGVSNLPVIRLLTQTDTGTTRLDKVVLRLGGTTPVNYISAVKIYRDSNSDGSFDGGDTLITSGGDVFSAGERSSTVTITALSAFDALKTVGSAPSYFFITVDISAGAQEGYDFNVRISTASDFTPGNPSDTVSLSSSPFSAGSAFDSANPAASGFATSSSTGGWLGASQWTKLATGVTARILAQDLVSGLSMTTGAFSVQYSTNAGAAWTTIVSTLAGAGPYLAWTGTHGSTAAQTLTAYNLAVIQSTNAQTCSGAPCGATDQLRFNLADRVGNAITAGPYSVLTDTTLPTGVTAAATGIGDYTVSVLAWASDALSGVKDYNHELALSIDFDTGYSSSNFTGTAYSFTGLSDGATYYLRSYARDNAYNLSAPSTAVSTMTSGIVYFTAQDAAPAQLAQGTSAAFLIFDLNANPGRSTYLQQVKVARLGNIPDADISAAYIYQDDGDGSFGAGDSQIGSALVTAGTATINVTPQFIAGAVRRFFVVYKLSSSVGVGKTVGARLDAAPGLTFTYPFRAVGTFPADSAISTVTDGPNILNITPSSLASGVVQPGVTDLAVVKLLTQTDTGTTRLDKVVLRLGGNAPANYINAVKVYRDSNSNGVFDLGGDALITSGGDVFSSGERSSTVTFTASAALKTVGAAPTAFFIAVDIAAGAQEGYDFNIRISAASDFTSGSPSDTILLSVSPFTSNTLVIQTNNTATIDLAGAMPATVDQGGLYQAAVATLNVSVGVTQLSRVKVNRLGLGSDSDASVSIYQDLTLDGGSLNPNVDLLLGSAAFSGGVATVNLATVTVSAGINTALFYALNISSLANPGGTIGIGVTNADYFTLPAYTLSKTVTPLPFTTGTAEIKAVINRLMLTGKADLTTGVIYEGAADYPMLKLQFAADRNQAFLTAVRVEKTGTLSDSLVTALKIFRDDDANGEFGAGDALVTQGGDLFSGGSSNLSFTAPQAINTSARNYFVTINISQNVEAGYTVGLSVPATSYFTVSAPNIASTGPVAYPVSAGPVDVQLYPNTVTISTAGVYPAGVYPGGVNVQLLKLTARADVSKAKLLSMRFERSGTSFDSDIAKVKLYYDLNNYGYFDPDALSNYLLVTPSTVTFGSDGTAGTAFLNISSAAQTVTTLPSNYFLVMDIAPGAEVGRTIVVRALNNSYFTVNAGNSVAAISPFGTAAITIQAPKQTLYASFQNQLSTWVVQGQNTILVSSFTLYASSYTIDLSEMDIMRAGTGYDSDISELRLYRDDGNGSWGGTGEEPLLSSAAFSGGIAAFNAAQTLGKTPRTYYLVANISASAAYGRTFGITVPAVSYLKVNFPHVVSPASFPFNGQLALIQPTVDILMITPQDSAPSLKQGDANKVMGRLVMAADQNSVTLASVRFDKTGNLLDADITAVRAWADDGNGSFSSLNDSLVAQAGGFSNGYAVLSFAPAQALDTSNRTYFVTVSVSSLATVGATFGMRASAQNFSVLAPDSLSVAGSAAVFSMVGTLADDPDLLSMRFSNRAPASLYQGTLNNYMAKLELWTNRDRAVITALRVDLAGNILPSDIMVKLYKDTDGSGAFNSTYDVLAASAQVSGTAAALNFSEGLNVTASTATFFLMMDIAGSASLGSTAGLGFVNEANFTLAGEDAVAPFSDFVTTVGAIKDSKVPTPPLLFVYKANGELFGDEAARYNAYRTRVRFTWESSVIMGAIEQVYYYVGSAQADESAPAASWTGGGLNREIWATGLDLDQAGSYYLCVRTRNSLDGSYSDIVCRQFSVDAIVPELASGALSAIQEQNSMLITWYPATFGPSGLAYYKVEERKADSPLWVHFSTTALRTVIIGTGAIGVSGSVRPSQAPGGEAASRSFKAAAVINRSPGTYFYRVTPVNGAGLAGAPAAPLRVDLSLASLNTITGVSAYPNPFDSRTAQATIHFQLNASGRAAVKIYDIYGKKVKSLDSAPDTVHDLNWDGTDSSGKKVSKGIYIGIIEAVGDSARVKIGVIH